MYTSYIISALAAAGLAAAQGACSGTKNIQNSGDAESMSSCTTWDGSVVIASSTTDDIDIPVQTITGDLTANQAKQISSLGGSSLKTIKGTFKLVFARSLSTLSFPQLSTVGNIDWQTLPKLNGLDFTTGVSMAKSVSIVDTQLASLEGISLRSFQSFVLTSNGLLKQVELQASHFDDELTMIDNGVNAGHFQLSLPNLRYGKSFNLQDITTLSIPQLGAVNGTFNLQSSSITSLDAPKLTEVDSTLTIVKNPNLSSLKMDKLQQIINGGFVIRSCPKLTKIDSLGSLTKIDGNLDFTGNFDEVDLPKLHSVTGAFNLQSTGDIASECHSFSSKNSQGLFQGKFNCKTDDSNPTGLNGQTSSGSEGGSGDGTSIGGNGAGNIFPSLLAVGAAAGFAILGFF